MRLVNGFREFNGELYYQIFKQPYRPEILEEVLSAGVSGLIVNEMSGATETGFEFLQDWTHLLRCRIIDFQHRLMTPLHHLKELEYLSYDGNTRSEISAESFPHLKKVDIIAMKETKTFLQVETLSDAIYHELKFHRAGPHIHLPQLKTLALFSSNLESLSPFQSSQKLRKVRLANCRKFKNSRSLILFPELEDIEIQDARSVDSFEVFNEMPKLKKLRIEGAPREWKNFNFRSGLDVLIRS